MKTGTNPYDLTLTDPQGAGFFWKLALTRTPDPNRPTRRGIFLKTGTNPYDLTLTDPQGGGFFFETGTNPYDLTLTDLAVILHLVSFLSYSEIVVENRGFFRTSMHSTPSYRRFPSE